MRRAAWASLAALLAAPAAAEPVSRCPPNTKAVRTADPRRPWACALSDERYREGIDCPRGFEPVTTRDPNDPFKCAQKGIELVQPKGLCPPGQQAIPTSDPDKDFECEKIPKGFGAGPGCPRGTVPVPTPGSLRPFRCVAAGQEGGAAEPSIQPSFGRVPPGKKPRPGPQPDKKGRCPKGTERVLTENPFEPVSCLDAKERPAAGSYRKYEARGEVSFDIPADWDLTDAWSDQPPSLYLLTDSGLAGRPVSLTITRQRRGAPGFAEMNEQIRREKEWHQAKVAGRGTVNGLPALHLAKEKESATAFLETGDGYYAISFSAPPQAYARFLPAYERLLKTLRHRQRR